MKVPPKPAGPPRRLHLKIPKNPGGRPKKDNVRIVAYVSAHVGKLFQDEAESRGLTLGELFEEICASRVTLIRR